VAVLAVAVGIGAAVAVKHFSQVLKKTNTLMTPKLMVSVMMKIF
jgi:hypothetical protein